MAHDECLGSDDGKGDDSGSYLPGPDDVSDGQRKAVDEAPFFLLRIKHLWVEAGISPWHCPLKQVCQRQCNETSKTQTLH